MNFVETLYANSSLGEEVVFHPHVEIDVNDLEKTVMTSSASPVKPKIMNKINSLYEKVNGQWQPAAICVWLEACHEDNGLVLVNPRSGKRSRFSLGYSYNFIREAREVLVSVYTAGPPLLDLADSENLARAYYANMILLAVLDKVGQQVVGCVEKRAELLGWGVSPYLSPGSVHGWELDEQHQLLSLLSTERIGVSSDSETAVLTPYMSIACLVGIGPDYERQKVGETCDVCIRREKCEIRRQKEYAGDHR